MTDTKPVPPTASAEGEAAALQAQAVDADTLNEDHVPKDTTGTTDTVAKSKKDADGGFKNYIVSRVASVYI
jgi:hypothetical protein